MKHAQDALPLDPLARDTLAFLTRLDRPRTRRTYRVALERFHEFKEQHKSKTRRRPSPTVHRADLDVRDLDDFQTWLEKHAPPFSPRTRQTYLAAAKSFFTFLLAQGWLSDHFSVERAKALQKQNRKPLSYPIPKPDEHLPALLAYADRRARDPDPGDSEQARRANLRRLRDRAFLYVLYASAARLSEISSLDRKTVADGRRDEATIVGKGGKERVIYFTPESLAALRAYLAERHDAYEPVFISHGRNYGARLNVSNLRRIVYQAAAACGIAAHPHDFRHFRARQMLDRGAPLEAIQEILGHSDISTTRRVYAHYSKPTIRAIFDKTADTPE